jgi:hypothetical protein
MSAFLSFSTSAARCGGTGVARALYWVARRQAWPIKKNEKTSRGSHRGSRLRVRRTGAERHGRLWKITILSAGREIIARAARTAGDPLDRPGKRK